MTKIRTTPTYYYPEEGVPFGDMTFKSWAESSITRLRLQRNLDLIPESRKSEIKLKHFYEALQEAGYDTHHPEDEIKDKIGYYILQIAYSSTQERIKTFVRWETSLLYYRLERIRCDILGPSPKREHYGKWKYWLRQELHRLEKEIGEENCPYKVMDLHHPRMKELKSQNQDYFLNGEGVDSEGVYVEIPWEYVSSLVGKRLCHLEEGMAYVPILKATHVLKACFAEYVHQQTEKAFHLRRLICRSNPRYFEFLKHIDKIMEDVYGRKGLPDLDEENPIPLSLSFFYQNVQKLFPPCAQKWWKDLHTKNHLDYEHKKNAIFMLCSFKLSVEDGQKIFEVQYCRKNLWTKKEEYEVKRMFRSAHKYNTVGCTKLIADGGCPWKNDGPAQIEMLIRSVISDEEAIADIKRNLENKEYQVVCGLFFQYSHNDATPFKYMHPTAYFKRALKLSQEESERPPQTLVTVEGAFEGSQGEIYG